MMHDDFYQMYMEEVEGIKPCDEAETAVLVAGVLAKDLLAEEKLIEGKLKYVLEIAKEYADQGLPMGDLVQEANIILTAFTKAFKGTAESYDQELSAAVREHLSHAVEDQNTEKEIKETMLARVNVLQQISGMMADELGREASVEELAKRMKMTVDDIKDIMKLALDALSVSPGTEE